MKTYELTYIISPEITLEEAEAKAKEIESAVASKEGAVLNSSKPFAKTLSYPVAGRASGFVGVLEFQVEPEKFVDFQKIIQKDGKIVRHMVIIKKLARIRKERTRKPVVTQEIEKEPRIEAKEIKPASASKGSGETKGKIELKDIEQELDEILS